MAHLNALFGSLQQLEPESLADMCFRTICDNLDIISVKDESGYRMLREGLKIPSEIGDKLIEFVQRSNNVEANDCFFAIFRSTKAAKLKRVKISSSFITDWSIRVIVGPEITHLELDDCCELTGLSIEYINAMCPNLHSLAFRRCQKVVQHLLESPKCREDYGDQGYVFKAPNLRRLALDHVNILTPDYHLLLHGLTKLTHLDLSNATNITSFSFLGSVPHLVSLCFYNVRNKANCKDFIENICQLKKLRHLDISHANHTNGYYENANQVLSELIAGLPELVSLDIGGTNLAGTGVTEHSSTELHSESTGQSDIQGLAARVHNPLQFLGLYGTRHDACRRHDIPAKLIAGNANEEQILIALRVCMNNKQELLQKVLNGLYHVYRYETCKRMDQALYTVIEVMEKHLSERHIQISGSATLFYIVKMKEKGDFAIQLKRRIIGTLVAAMNAHKDEETMMRNGCLALCQFHIPQDVMWNWEALVKVLLHSARHAESEGYVQRIGIYLLNSLACQVEGKKKRLLGELGCVETMLDLVKYRVELSVFDDVLEVAWSTMWNMTDETPINCQRFLDEQGMSLFLRCVKQYPYREELLRNMLGLLGNVAEVDYLRVYLMQHQYVTVFANLMAYDSDLIEVSYNATGILAHMASDGVEAWTVKTPCRNDVLSRMIGTIDSWNLSAQRNINYRSFVPLLQLLDVYHTPQCQHWAVWALANLTRVYPSKYCQLLESEDGLDKLTDLIKDRRPYAKIKSIAFQVFLNCGRQFCYDDL